MSFASSKCRVVFFFLGFCQEQKNVRRFVLQLLLMNKFHKIISDCLAKILNLFKVCLVGGCTVARAATQLVKDPSLHFVVTNLRNKDYRFNFTVLRHSNVKIAAMNLTPFNKITLKIKLIKLIHSYPYNKYRIWYCQ